MRLFYRSLYSFIALILFQAVLTVFLVTSVTDRTNSEEARLELAQKASVSYDAVTGWIRSLWKEMITIQQEGALSVTADPFSARGLLELEDYYRSRLFSSGFDYFVIRQEPMSWNRAVVNPAYQLATLAPDTFSIAADHPTIRYYRDGDAVAMVGGFRLYGDGERALDLFVAKHMDDTFCRVIASRSNAPVILSTPTSTIGGSVNVPAIAAPLALGDMELSYREHEPTALGDERFRAAVKRLGRIAPTGETLYLATLVSDRRYADRIRLVTRTAFLVSTIAAVLSAFFSLFFSRYLSRPAQLLIAGMRRVKRGVFEPQLDSPRGDEFSALFRGFNSMAAELQEDRNRMDRYIAEITQLKEYNEAIIHSIGAGIAIIGRELRVEKANATFRTIAGLAGEGDGRELAALKVPFLDGEVYRRIHEVVRGDRPHFSKRIRNPGDRVYDVKLYTLSPHIETVQTEGCVLVVEDVTIRDDLESKMYRAEKIASISLLSAGVAHEINNPLSSITTNVQNLISENEDPEQGATLTLIDQETRRIAGIIRNLLDFATADRENDSSCDAARVIRETTELLRSYMEQSRTVEIVVAGDAEALPVAIGSDELRQILMNLLINASQAIERNGQIVVETAVTSGGVVLRVRDNGSGIPDEYRSRIFDPFFTTKPNGRGTGLGLSVVYGIITEYGGTVDVESREGEGTTVELFLPQPAKEVVIHG